MAVRPQRARQTRASARLPIEAASAEPVLVSEGSLDNVSLTGDPVAADDPVGGLHLAGVRWSGGRFAGLRLANPRMVDVVFAGCDLSGVVIDGGGCARVEFHDCRMTGTVLAGSRLTDVFFARCKLNLANMRMTVGQRVHFVECDLTETDFYAAKITDARIHDSDLVDTDFSQAELPAVRLHGSRLRNPRGLAALSGALLGAEQVPDMSLALFANSGMRVVDDDR